ncbi:AlpA family transcriptional regulator [Sulfitobacter sp. S190]|uniref:helix-turn-helix transcriptional regulator n=1 Tax=Sulfitobacter sp. S190 TaxID=2867022 RepID=UPI0021A6E1EE|nr:AlpA family phage regulatory protein [Sulfitobacter sp. S190]UWR21289.1 AlpA family phage regulatory protein [Sulfitobacter sp. S190]
MTKAGKTEQLELFAVAVQHEKRGKKAAKPDRSGCALCAESYLSDRSVSHRYGISRATVWRWAEKNGNFPAPVKLSKGTSRWKFSDLVKFEEKLSGFEQKVIGDGGREVRDD